jgi:hypothetical protein
MHLLDPIPQRQTVERICTERAYAPIHTRAVVEWHRMQLEYEFGMQYAPRDRLEFMREFPPLREMYWNLSHDFHPLPGFVALTELALNPEYRTLIQSVYEQHVRPQLNKRKRI